MSMTLCLLFLNNVVVFFMINALVSSRNRKSQNVSEYVKEMPQSHTTDRNMAPQGRAKEQEQRHETQNTTKKSNQLSLPQRDDCKTRMDAKYCTTK